MVWRNQAWVSVTLRFHTLMWCSLSSRSIFPGDTWTLCCVPGRIRTLMMGSPAESLLHLINKSHIMTTACWIPVIVQRSAPGVCFSQLLQSAADAEDMLLICWKRRCRHSETCQPPPFRACQISSSCDTAKRYKCYSEPQLPLCG